MWNRSLVIDYLLLSCLDIFRSPANSMVCLCFQSRSICTRNRTCCSGAANGIRLHCLPRERLAVCGCRQTTSKLYHWRLSWRTMEFPLPDDCWSHSTAPTTCPRCSGHAAIQITITMENMSEQFIPPADSKWRVQVAICCTRS